MILSEITSTLARVRYRDWRFHVTEDGRGAWYLQVQFYAVDPADAERKLQHGRRWFLSPEMTTSEIVATAFKACITAEEHECREQFLYQGQAIFGPHLDVDALATMLSKFGSAVLDARPAATGPKSKRQAEREALESALAATNGNRERAAKVLGVARSTVFQMIKRHQVAEARV